jgi:hypothetical protein
MYPQYNNMLIKKIKGITSPQISCYRIRKQTKTVVSLVNSSSWLRAYSVLGSVHIWFCFNYYIDSPKMCWPGFQRTEIWSIMRWSNLPRVVQDTLIPKSMTSPSIPRCLLGCLSQLLGIVSLGPGSAGILLPPCPLHPSNSNLHRRSYHPYNTLCHAPFPIPLEASRGQRSCVSENSGCLVVRARRYLSACDWLQHTCVLLRWILTFIHILIFSILPVASAASWGFCVLFLEMTLRHPHERSDTQYPGGQGLGAFRRPLMWICVESGSSAFESSNSYWIICWQGSCQLLSSSTAQ